MTAAILGIIAAVFVALWLFEWMRSRKKTDLMRVYQSVYQALPTGLNVWHLVKRGDPGSLRLVASNPEAARATGIPSVDWVGQSIVDVFPEAVPRGIADQIAEVARTGVVKDLGEISYGDARMPEGFFTVFAFPIPGDRVAVAFSNVTKQKLAELAVKRKSSFVELLQGVAIAANQARDVRAALKTSLPEICKRTGWPVGLALLRATDGGASFAGEYLWHLTDPSKHSQFRQAAEAREFDPAAGLPARVLKGGSPQWVVDLGSEPGLPEAATATACGLRSAYAFPITVAGRVEGVLEFYGTDTWMPDDLLLDIMSSAGLQLGRVIERQRE